MSTPASTPPSTRATLGPRKLIIYDLDGTLLDAFEDIRRALNHGLATLGLPPKTLDETRGLVGEGVVKLIERALGPENQHLTGRALGLVKTYYQDNPASVSTLYPGVMETLAELRRRGYLQAILTNKPHEIAVDACARLGLAAAVDRVQGEDASHPLKPDPRAALTLIADMGASPAEAVIVGDGDPDVALARAAGLPVVACSWGVNTQARMRELGADALIDSISDLLALLPGAEPARMS